MGGISLRLTCLTTFHWLRSMGGVLFVQHRTVCTLAAGVHVSKIRLFQHRCREIVYDRLHTMIRRSRQYG
jgi:hypothetical protein